MQQTAFDASQLHDTELRTTTDDPAAFLAPTYFMDSDHPSIVAFAEANRGEGDDKARAIKLFYPVRDGVRYDPYYAIFKREIYKASHILEAGRGYCIQKGGLLAAVLRADGIPARPGYADVTNHLASPRLIELLGSNLFVWHSYVEVWLNGRWIKCTPAFNLELCQKFNTLPLDWDGETDSLFHPYDGDGRKHMEYVRDYGTYNEIPLAAIEAGFRHEFPKAYGDGGSFAQGGDFWAEAEAAGQSA